MYPPPAPVVLCVLLPPFTPSTLCVCYYRFDLTWGPLEYHRRSLDNLQAAMRKTRKLCAIVLDTLGREVMIRRPFRLEPDGWPNQAGQEIEIKLGQVLTLTTRGEGGAVRGCCELVWYKLVWCKLEWCKLVWCKWVWCKLVMNQDDQPR